MWLFTMLNQEFTGTWSPDASVLMSLSDHAVVESVVLCWRVKLQLPPPLIAPKGTIDR
jgi:hypothetical protein